MEMGELPDTSFFDWVSSAAPAQGLPSPDHPLPPDATHTLLVLVMRVVEKEVVMEFG